MINQEKIYRAALEHWGEDAQIGQYHEEIAESIVAINKYRRDPCESTRRRVMEELADVVTVLGQMLIVFKSPDCESGMDSDEYRGLVDERLEELRHKLNDRAGVHPICDKCIHGCNMPSFGYLKSPWEYCDKFSLLDDQMIDPPLFRCRTTFEDILEDE